MKPVRIGTLLLVVLVACGLSGSGIAVGAATRQNEQTQNHAIKLQGLLDALRNHGLSQAELIKRVKERGVDFLPTPQAEAALRKAGASDALIQAVRDQWVPVEEKAPQNDVETFLTEQAEARYKAIEAKGKRFNNYIRDFLDLGKSYRYGSDEYGVATELYNIADWANESTNSISPLLTIYDSASCESDRAVAGSIIKQRITYYTGRIDLEIKLANSSLSLTTSPALAASGTQLKDDLRGLKELLESIHSQLIELPRHQ
jgi:hypothetical protein